MLDGATIQAMSSAVQSAAPYAHAISVGLQAGSQIAQGNEASTIAAAEAQQFKDRANNELALGSIQAQRLAKAVERQRSRVQAVLAGAGFVPNDQTGKVIDREIVKEGSIQEQLAIAQAADEAAQDRWRASLRRSAGRSEKRASVIKAASTLVGGYFSWRDRFGAASTPTSTDPATSSTAAQTSTPFVDDWLPATAHP